jgi:hypothetical protein
MGCSVWGAGDYASWGDRFAEVGARLVAEVARTVTVRWPSVDYVIDALPDLGPLMWAVEKLRADGTWDAACAALTEMLTAEASATSPALVVEVPYAVAIETRPG